MGGRRSAIPTRWMASAPRSRPAGVAGAERAAFAAPSLFRSLCMGLTSPALRNTCARTSRPVWTIRPLSNTIPMPPVATLRHSPPQRRCGIHHQQQRCGIHRPPTRTRRAVGATELRPSASGSPCRLPNRPACRLAGSSGRLTSLSSLLPRRLGRFRPVRSLQHNYNGGRANQRPPYGAALVQPQDLGRKGPPFATGLQATLR